MFKNIKFIYFDLDNTIFDHKRVEQSTLRKMHSLHAELYSGVRANDFLDVYHSVNVRLWKDFADDKINSDELKVKRFEETLTELKLDTKSASKMSVEYMEKYSGLGFMIDGAVDVLNYLKPKYRLGILSNGFPDIQRRKIENMKIGSFFEHFIYSGDVGALKPSPIIFEAAQFATGQRGDEIVYVGDSFESDVLGAHAVGWRAIFFDAEQSHQHQDTADARITSLAQLKEIL